jgi:hypothetical protein
MMGYFRGSVQKKLVTYFLRLFVKKYGIAAKIVLKLVKYLQKPKKFTLWAELLKICPMKYFENQLFMIWEGFPKIPIISLDRIDCLEQ